MTAAPLPPITVLYSAEAIAARVDALATEIAATFPPNPLVVAILKGSFVFAADLIRALHRAGVAPEVEFMSLSSYGAGTESRGAVTVLRDIEGTVGGRHILIVDDILESGRTAAFARDLLLSRGAARVSLAVLLEKAGKLKANVTADHVGFACPDQFVVGYGMDAAHAFRQLPFIGVVAGADEHGVSG